MKIPSFNSLVWGSLRLAPTRESGSGLGTRLGASLCNCNCNCNLDTPTRGAREDIQYMREIILEERGRE